MAWTRRAASAWPSGVSLGRGGPWGVSSGAAGAVAEGEARTGAAGTAVEREMPAVAKPTRRANSRREMPEKFGSAGGCLGRLAKGDLLKGQWSEPSEATESVGERQLDER